VKKRTPEQGMAKSRAYGQHRIALVKRYLAVSSVDGAGGGVDEVADGVRAAGLEHAEESIQIGAHIGARSLEGIAHARLRGQMHHIVRPAMGEQGFEPVVIGNVAGSKSKPLVGDELGKAGALEVHVVVAVQIVDAVDGGAGGEQSLSKMKADEARRTRHQDRLRSEVGCGHHLWLFAQSWLLIGPPGSPQPASSRRRRL